MYTHLARWIGAVLVAGMIAAGATALSPEHKTRTPATTARGITAAAPESTTTRAAPATADMTRQVALTTAPAPPRSDAPPTIAPPVAAEPVSVIRDVPPPATAVPLPEVAIYGDSLTVAAWGRYSEVTYGEVDTRGHAFGGAVLPDWSAAIQRDTVNRLVLALGTNDAKKDGARPWAELLSSLPATKCIVWPKPYEGSNEVKLFNAQMAVVVTAHPNLHVVDWDATVKAHPQWVASDHTHYSTEGSDHYAAMLKDAALTCP